MFFQIGITGRMIWKQPWHHSERNIHAVFRANLIWNEKLLFGLLRDHCCYLREILLSFGYKIFYISGLNQLKIKERRDMLENWRKENSIWRRLRVSRTGIKRCHVCTYKYTHDSFNLFISRSDGNEDLLKSFWGRFHKPSQDARDLGFRVLAGIWQETFTVAVTGTSCTRRLCVSDIL